MSGASAQVPTAAADVAHPVHGQPVLLNGRTTNLVIADRKGIAQITGSGRLSGLGRVTITGSVNSKAETPLLSSPWLLYADLEIVTAKGQINVHATPGTIGLNPFAQPFHLQYSVQGGTGAFRHATGKGLLDLTLAQSVPTNLAELKQMGVQLDTQGIRFSLHFHPGHLSQWGNYSSMWYGIIQTLVKHSDNHGGHHAKKPKG
jgi:hypothetical protein